MLTDALAIWRREHAALDAELDAVITTKGETVLRAGLGALGEMDRPEP